MNGLSIILPAHNEAAYLPACLKALLASDPAGCPLELIVVVNGSTDATCAVATRAVAGFEAAGWAMRVLDLKEGGKPNALNEGDRVAGFAARMYLDADVEVSKALLAGIVAALNASTVIYCSGCVQVTAGQSRISRAYARFYATLPFIREGVPGCGLFAVNGAARKRWTEFPPIISDDTFVRLHFTPAERFLVPAPYRWPVVEGFAALVRVRRRQDQGVDEIRQKYQELEENDDRRSSRAKAAFWGGLRHPFGFLVYLAVALAVRLRPARDMTWSRGR